MNARTFATVWMCLVLSQPLSGQIYVFENAREVAVELGRVGSTILVEGAGPLTCGGCSSPLARGLPIRWIMVQDTAMGVVFTEPSGVKPTGGFSDSFLEYDGDVDLRTTVEVTAIEVRALTFDVWGDFGKLVSVEQIYRRDQGATWSFNPRWSDLGAPTRTHTASIMWVHRVRYADGAIRVQVDTPVVEAWRLLTGLQVDDSLLREPILGRSSD